MPSYVRSSPIDLLFTYKKSISYSTHYQNIEHSRILQSDCSTAPKGITLRPRILQVMEFGMGSQISQQFYF